MTTPVITVAVPVYRGKTTVIEALESVVRQNVTGLEILVLDDGCPDQTGKAAEAYLDKFGRSNFSVSRHSNIGLAATLNRGIGISQGKYVARQDQDDIILPGRLEKQKKFLEKHPAIAMVGTHAAIHVGDAASGRYHRHPTTHQALQFELLFDNPFVHSSMMIRADVLRKVGGYCEDKSRQPPEDYELWSRIARSYQVANLPEVLTIYRETPGSMSRIGPNPFLQNVLRISSENLHHFLRPHFSDAEARALAELYHLGGSKGFNSSPSRKQVGNMLSLLANSIMGPKEVWSEEFKTSFQRVRRHLHYRLLRGRIPDSIVRAAKLIKQRFTSPR